MNAPSSNHSDEAWSSTARISLRSRAIRSWTSGGGEEYLGATFSVVSSHSRAATCKSTDWRCTDPSPKRNSSSRCTGPRVSMGTPGWQASTRLRTEGRSVASARWLPTGSPQPENRSPALGQPPSLSPPPASGRHPPRQLPALRPVRLRSRPRRPRLPLQSSDRWWRSRREGPRMPSHGGEDEPPSPAGQEGARDAQPEGRGAPPERATCLLAWVPVGTFFHLLKPAIGQPASPLPVQGSP